MFPMISAASRDSRFFFGNSPLFRRDPLINDDKLIDLLIERRIGVHEHPILAVDPETSAKIGSHPAGVLR